MPQLQVQSAETGSISVVILCGDEAGLATTIESVQAQTYAATEIIVVDHSLTKRLGDSTIQDVPPLSATTVLSATALSATNCLAGAETARGASNSNHPIPQVRWLRVDNPSFAAACNAALEVSQSDYILFLQTQNRLMPRALEIGVNCLESMLECGFVVGVGREQNTPGLPLLAAADLYDQISGVPIYQSLLSGSCFAPSARILFRRRVFEQVGGFDETLAIAAEYDLHLRAAAAFTGCRHNQVVVEYQLAEPITTEPTVDEPDDSALSPSQALRMHLNVLHKQRRRAKRSAAGWVAYQTGKQYWSKLYGPALVQEGINCCQRWQFKPATQILQLLLCHYPQGFSQLWLSNS